MKISNEISKRLWPNRKKKGEINIKKYLEEV